MPQNATPETFALDVSKWVAKAEAKGALFVSEFVQDLNQAIVEATPVKTGFLRGSWWANVNSLPAGAGGTIDKSGSGSIARLNLVAAEMKPGDVFYAMNGAAYAHFVEFGTSRMAPRAFVRTTLARAQLIADATLARISAEGA